MDQETIKRLTVGNRIVRINIDFDNFEDDMTLPEEWLTIEKINLSHTFFTCRNLKQEIVIFWDSELKNYSTTSEKAYEVALEKLKERQIDTIKKITLCELKLNKRNEAKWIGTSYDGYADGEPVYDTYECSSCGQKYFTDDVERLPNFCPNCGKRMRLEND